MKNKSKKNSYKIVTILIVSLLLSTFTNVMAATPTVNPALGVLPAYDSYGYNEEWYNSGIYVGHAYTSNDDSISVASYIRVYSGSINNPVYYGYLVNSHDSNYVYLVCATLIDEGTTLGAAGVGVQHSEKTDSYSSLNVLGVFSNLTSLGYVNYYGDTNTGRNQANLDGNFYRNSVDSSIVYDSFSDFMDDIVNYQAPVASQSLNYSLPAGNVIFVELPNDSDENSFVATTSSAVDHSTPWTTGNQKYGLLDSIPSTVNANISGTTPFTWYGTGSNSVFGTYKTWRSTHDIRTGNYLCIINPAYPSDTPENQALNGAINITVERAISFKVYQLNAGWTDGSIDNSGTGVTYDGTYDENTGQWSTVDQNGNASSPVSGGSNAGFSTDGMTITQWLENIAHQISGFFTGAIGAINTLVSAIGNIATELHGLYVWLPPAVQGILTSALILAITIGVIKVFI